MGEISAGVRVSIRGAAADMARARDIPAEQFPGHKAIYMANLEGYLGSFAVRLLDALEQAEAELEVATAAASDGYALDGAAGILAKALAAAHDPALGLDRSVCLRDVVEFVEKLGSVSASRRESRVAEAIAREFSQHTGQGPGDA
jgi:hypothetical protein